MNDRIKHLMERAKNGDATAKAELDIEMAAIQKAEQSVTITAAPLTPNDLATMSSVAARLRPVPPDLPALIDSLSVEAIDAELETIRKREAALKVLRRAAMARESRGRKA